MPDYDISIDEKRGMAYIPKKIRECLGLQLKVTPDYRAAALFPKDADPEEILDSLETLQRHFEQMVEKR